MHTQATNSVTGGGCHRARLHYKLAADLGNSTHTVLVLPKHKVLRVRDSERPDPIGKPELQGRPPSQGY